KVAINGIAARFLSPDGVCHIAPKNPFGIPWGNELYGRYPVLYGFRVLQLQLQAPARPITIVRHTGTHGPDEHTVHGHTLECLFEPVVQSFGGARKGNVDKNTPKHPNDRDHGPGLVLANGTENLLPCIAIK